MQETAGGILLGLIGLMLLWRPMLVFPITEQWKTNESSTPSKKYLVILRLVGALLIWTGVLLTGGIFH